MALHVTITDLDNNRVLVDTDTNAIIASIDEGERVRGFNHIKCDVDDFASVVAVARIKIEEALEDESAAVLAAVERAHAFYTAQSIEMKHT
jgi:hypothetical protein